MWIHETQKKYLIFSLAMVLVLPMLVSLHHHLMQHEVIICNAEGEQHVHEYHYSCDHAHFYNTDPGIEPGNVVHCLQEIIRHNGNQLNPRNIDDGHSYYCEVRGPPEMTVLRR